MNVSFRATNTHASTVQVASAPASKRTARAKATTYAHRFTLTVEASDLNEASDSIERERTREGGPLPALLRGGGAMKALLAALLEFDRRCASCLRGLAVFAYYGLLYRVKKCRKQIQTL